MWSQARNPTQHSWSHCRLPMLPGWQSCGMNNGTCHVFEPGCHVLSHIRPCWASRNIHSSFQACTSWHMCLGELFTLIMHMGDLAWVLSVEADCCLLWSIAEAVCCLPWSIAMVCPKNYSILFHTADVVDWPQAGQTISSVSS